jgi:hypothetical protein
MRGVASVGWILLCCAVLGYAQTPAPSADEDEVWIERFVQAQPRAVEAAAAPPTIAFSELPGLQGAELAITLRDGRVRRGALERADRSSLVLQQSMGGGRYAFTIQRADVARIVRGEG